MLVTLSHDGPVSRLRLDRPDARNALSIDLCNEIVASLTIIDERLETRVVVLEGAGKVFCSGADFAAVSGPSALDFLPVFEGMLETVARFRLPVIARIHGAALGGGLQLASVCDFRIATEDSQIGIPSSRLGIVINYENVQRLVLLCGSATAKLVLMTGKTFSGAEAKDAGLVTDVTPVGELDGVVDELAMRIAALAPLSVQGAKRAINAVTDQFLGEDEPDAVQKMQDLVAQAYRSKDLGEGLTALAEKREPRFEGS